MVTRDGDPRHCATASATCMGQHREAIRKAAEPLRDDDELAALAGNAAATLGSAR